MINRFSKLIFVVLCLILFSIQLQAGLKIYYLRHAEAGHNVRKEWENIPKAQWPIYVGNPNMFTPKGESQVLKVAEKLKKYHFDLIAVSPAWRTRNTILPYLKLMGLKGEIWPELNENKAIAKQILSTDLPTPSSQILNAGEMIQLPADESASLILRKDGKYLYKINQSEEDLGYSADVKFVIQSLINRIHKQFGGTEKSILLVGHANSGKDLLKLLLKDNLDKTHSMINTGIWMVEEQSDGSYKLKIYNDEPCLN
jgi:broad specificity phosphatase PhoE